MCLLEYLRLLYMSLMSQNVISVGCLIIYGLLELVQSNVSDDRLISSTERTNTFGHVGNVVEIQQLDV